MFRLFNRSIRILLVTDALTLMAGSMLGPIYALFVEHVGGDVLDAGYAFAAFAGAAGITTLLSGRFADSFREKELIVVLGYFLIGSGFVAYAFVDSIWALMVVQGVIGFGQALYAPAFDALYSRHLDGRKAGREWGAWESINYFTAAIGALLGGIVVTTFGFPVLFGAMGLLCFLSAAYIFLLPRQVL